MTEIQVGKVMLTFKGEYDNTKTYTRLDAVTYQGSSYVCLSDTTSAPPSESWQLLADKGATGDVGPQGADGKTSYLHIAYANSADGKDGFYVGGGTNLLTGTGNHTVTGTGPSYANSYLSNETTDDLLTLFKGLEGQTVTVSVDYEYSGFIAGSSNNRLGWEIQIIGDTAPYVGPWYDPTNGSGSGRISSTFVVPKNITSIGEGYGYIQFSGSGTGTLSHFKLEKGSVATPWSPAPSEAHPNYIGTYTDYTQADSLDPTAYLWLKIKGADGAQGIPGPQGPKGDTGATGATGPAGPAGKDGQTPDVSKLATKTDLANYYTKTETDTKLSTKADQAEYQTLNEQITDLQTAVKAQQSAAIDTSNVSTSKKPSDYSDGIFYELKSVSTLGLDRSGIASELQQGTNAIVTTKVYSGMARQMAEVIDSATPATFIRNGNSTNWSNWYISQLTAM